MSSSPTLRERLVDELKLAMKSGDKARVSAVRLIQAAVKDKDIESRGAGRGQASDDEILSVMQKMIKQRQESAAIYAANARPELAETENGEIAVIASFMPKQLSEDEVKAAIADAIAQAGASSMKDMGKVVAVLKAAYAGQMDFAKASGLVKNALSG
ncbi:MAG: GatB/YqeY domain-containing protein [Beijerinckiaceae bacterium]|nr:GatB/YqeY domain-containing protein [Beijerinckiaceae bacterium]